ncbi:Hypothetical protein, putative [Bodo saltans]|uniref:Uncharacterized protein n=1 Tax=Bodo saltans TaxID=75058 RepID=A0A0S4IP53_BODSA|nr:Hypothetical protein, putative [Bodo saltans]|eukprot:CUE98971.1 Hypothetical protein, putative [Bodo saltans]
MSTSTRPPREGGGGVWVPRRLLVNGTFGPDIRASPQARPIDAATLFPSETAKLTEQLGLDTTLILAEHTTSPDWFYNYLQHLGDSRYVVAQQATTTEAADDCGSTTPVEEPNNTDESVVKEGAANTLGRSEKEVRRRFPYIPHSVTGGLFRPKLAEKLTLSAQQNGYESPWWIPEAWVNRRNPLWSLATSDSSTPALKLDGVGWYNLEQTIMPGSCCAMSAAYRCYEPYTIFGGQFPRSLEHQMQRAAVHFGWNKRLWLTLDEASKLEGVTLKEGEVSSCMTSVMNRDGFFPSVYFCGSQFDDPHGHLPLLRDIQQLGSGGIMENAGRYQKLFDPQFGKRPCEEWMKSVGAIARGRQPIANSVAETNRVGAIVVKPLHQHSALRQSQAPEYLRLNESKRLGNSLPLKPHAQGRCVHGRHISMKDAVYFNAEDFEFPAIAASMVSYHPVHLLTYHRFFGPMQLKMVEWMATREQQRVSLSPPGGDATLSTEEQQRNQHLSKFWAPSDFLERHGFEVPNLSTTFHVQHGADLAYLPNRPWQGNLGNAHGTMRSFVSLADVNDPSGRLRAIAEYLPKKLDGTYFTGIARAGVLDVAIEHDLLGKDCHWVSDGVLRALHIDASAFALLPSAAEPGDSARSADEPAADSVTSAETENLACAPAGRTRFYPMCLIPPDIQDLLKMIAFQQQPVQTNYNKMLVPRHQRASIVKFTPLPPARNLTTTQDGSATEGEDELIKEATDMISRNIYQTTSDASVL